VLESFGENIRKLKMLHIEVESEQIWENQKLSTEVYNLLNHYGFKNIYYNGLYLGGNVGDSIWIKN
jgi:hypothetical protein